MATNGNEPAAAVLPAGEMKFRIATPGREAAYAGPGGRAFDEWLAAALGPAERAALGAAYAPDARARGVARPADPADGPACGYEGSLRGAWEWALAVLNRGPRGVEWHVEIEAAEGEKGGPGHGE